MQLSEFFVKLSKHQAAARERLPEYLNCSLADSTFAERTAYEFLMDLSDRLDKVEKTLWPEVEENSGPKFT